MLNKGAYLIFNYYTGETLEKLSDLFEKAASGSAKDKFEFALGMCNLNSAYFAPSHVFVYKQALDICEEAAEEGCVEAMEFAASLYATGRAHSKIEETHSNMMTTMVETPQPDFYKAKMWALRAQAKGSEWAAKALPHLEKDIARVAGLPPEEPNNPPRP